MKLTSIYAGTLVPGTGYVPKNIGTRLQTLVRDKLQELSEYGGIVVSVDRERHCLKFIDKRQRIIELQPLPMDHVVIKRGEIYELVSKEELIPKFSTRFMGNPK